MILQTAGWGGVDGAEIYNRLKAAGVPATFVEITGSVPCGPSGTPSRVEKAKMIADFFDQSLK